ncbi:helix-turn-helix transcriptional regulator [Vibrio tapetis]|uniref:Prophage CP4-57 regulatory family protein n=1 Tax=Vibrio tapetis subsp. tapetis TaxID=1671868 RepID=A0A2N8Z8E8_9VIBR|nr:AlpA family phage regulatory protein [Vibrio tapetis]SON48156.1 Prophage CP4-57 regulatory family protein [Vibrio tapetis subsp. tapetis]
MTRDKIMSLQEVAAEVKRSPRTVWRWWAKDKSFPKPIQMNGRCLGWRESVFVEWLNKQGGE